MKCGEHVSLKSDLAIKKELDRIGAYLKPEHEVSCQNERCANHRRSVDKRPRGYHEQCLAFAGARERELPNTSMSHLYISTDRQDCVLNWTDRNLRFFASGRDGQEPV